jgi:hypothetical protein
VICRGASYFLLIPKYYYIINIIKSRRMRGGHVTRMGGDRKVFSAFVRNPEGKRPLERPRRRWEDGIRMHIG